MGFFGIIETFFFVSLAITFILIMLLVYHFKQRLIDVETKTDNMFEIMNNLLKEMKVMKTMVIEQGQSNMYCQQPSREHSTKEIYEDSPKPPQFGNLFEMIMPFLHGGNQGETPMDQNEDENDMQNPIKIITLDKENAETIDIEDIEDIEDNENIENIDVDELESYSNNNEELSVESEEPTETLEKIDYKSLDISQLRVLAVNRGIDPSKKKKAELIQLLQ